MSGFKRVNKSDVVVLPYTANKQWEFIPSNLSTGSIRVYNGQKSTTLFNPDTDYITNGEYDRLVFESINHLYYQQFSGSFLNTGSLMRSNYYEGSTEKRPSGSYYNYGDVSQTIRLFPTGSSATIKVLSIPKSLYSNKVNPGSFDFSSSYAHLVDDKCGNLFDGNVFVGNIFYEHGIVVITNSDYQNIFPLPPFAQNDHFSYYASQTYPQYFNPLSNDDARSCVILTGSLFLFGGDLSVFESSSNGTVNINSTYSSIPGTYTTYYTVNGLYASSSNNSIMTSNTASISITVIPPFLYYNEYTSSLFQKSNCTSGGTGSLVLYEVPAGTFSTGSSQADANRLASASIAANGQTYANSNGSCAYYNAVYTGSFQKNSCGNGGIGSFVTYTVSAGQITSSVSQADANTRASASVAANGQAYANANGTCAYYNILQSGLFTRNNCNPYFSGSTVEFTASAGIFSSSISLNDANTQAFAYVNANGQTYANSNGTCTTTQPVTIDWLDFQVGGVGYTDCNLRITKYSPASNPSGVVVVDSSFSESGSFSALVGDRIYSEAYAIDPWPLTGTSSMYLDVYGQSGSHQITHTSSSILVSDIVLINPSHVYISGYTSYSSGYDNMISGSITTSANTVNITLDRNVPYSDNVKMTGLWNNGLNSGSWHLSYPMVSGSSTSGFATPIDDATSVSLYSYQYLSRIDKGTPWIGIYTGSAAGVFNLLRLNNPLA